MSRLTCTWLLALTAFAGCTTVDPALLDAEGHSIKDLEPAPYRVAVLPIKFEAGQVEANGLRFTWSEDQLRTALVKQLKDLDAATELVMANSLESVRSDNVADIVLEPMLTGSQSFTHDGLSSRWVAGGTFWLLTWVGGLFVEDSTYTTDLGLSLKVEGLTVDRLREAHFGSSPIDCSFLERNNVASLGFLQSLILPPFWTWDNQDLTSESLSGRAVTTLAGHLTKYIKDLDRNLEAEHGRLQVAHPPRNGGQVRPREDVEIRISSRTKLKHIVVLLNHAKEPLESVGRHEEADQNAGLYNYSLTIRGEQLHPGSNMIQVLTTANTVFARSIRVDVSDTP